MPVSDTAQGAETSRSLCVLFPHLPLRLRNSPGASFLSPWGKEETPDISASESGGGNQTLGVY